MKRQAEIEQICQLARRLRIAQEELDELVCDVAAGAAMPEVNRSEKNAEQESLISDAEAHASSINNGGLEVQIKFLLEQLGREALEAKLDQIKP